MGCQETSNGISEPVSLSSAGALATSQSWPDLWCPFDYDSTIPIGCTSTGCAKGAYVDLSYEVGAQAQACVTYFDDRGTGGACGPVSSTAGNGYASLFASGVGAWTTDPGPFDYAYVFVSGLKTQAANVMGYVVVTY